MRSDIAAEIVVILQAVFVLLAVGFRGLLQYRRTGDFGFRSPFDRSHAFGWMGGALYLGSSVMAPAAEFANWFARRTIPLVLVATGVALALVGMALTLVAQLQMRDSWRIGVDEREVTKLVGAGLFAYVRNPIFSGMLLVNVGIVLILPNLFSGLALAGAAILVEYQVRYVEEPYLIRTHGDGYRSYARTVGRFVPFVGYLK